MTIAPERGRLTPPFTPEQEERRRRLIDSAFRLGAEGGYDAVHMRDVAAAANVAMATVYRCFSSKDDLLAAAMTEWTGGLQRRTVKSPPKGDTAADQLVDLLTRACRAMQRQPRLTSALVRALSSSDPGVLDSAVAVQRSIAAMGDPILAALEPDARADILAVLGHVWYSSLMAWANGRRDFASVPRELERAVHALVDPHEARRQI